MMAAGPLPSPPMTDITKYLALQTALVNEKAKLEARLGEIFKALGRDDAVPAPAPSAPSSPATTTTPGKRTFSADTKAKMAAAQKARWAAKKGTVAVKAAVEAAPKAEPKPKRKISPEAKARMIAGAKKRWANNMVGSAPAPAAAPAAPKLRKLSAEGRANIVAATKARWAKVNALKAK